MDRITDPLANTQKLAPGTRKLVKFLELVNNGTPKDEALELCAHIAKAPKVRAKKPPGPSGAKKESNLKFRRKKITNQPTKIRIGPKSKTNQQKLKIRLLIQYPLVSTMMFLLLWIKFTYQLYHCPKEIAA